MTSLFNKLSDRYQNVDELHLLLTKYNLEETINTAIESIDCKMTDNQIQELPKLSGIILNEINSVISNIENIGEKKKIEYLLSDIFQDYINIILTQKKSENIITEIIENLRIACEYRGYDYNILTNVLGLEKITILKSKTRTKKKYYEWLKTEGELDEISRDLYDKKIIFSVKEFKKLFKPTSDSFYVKFNSKFKDEVIVLFHIFKEEKLIMPKGTSGHFSPLVQYAVDNENNFLINKAINKEHERIKKNSVRHSEIRQKLTIVIEQNLIKNRQWKDNGHYLPKSLSISS